MIVLDTNVISELMRVQPAPEVTSFIDGQPRNNLVTTTITVAEILYGIRRLAMGRRRSDLEASFADLMARGFRDRLLVFDEAAASCYSEITAERRRIGRSIQVFDTMIAGIAFSHGAKVATRNTVHFVDCGVEVVDPWAWSGAQE